WVRSSIPTSTATTLTRTGMWFFRLMSPNFCPRIDSSPKTSGVRLESSRAVVGFTMPCIAPSRTSCSPEAFELRAAAREPDPAQWGCRV
ncbi:Cyclin-dependent kinases regulatory subunit, partial [Psidium guajava]